MPAEWNRGAAPPLATGQESVTAEEVAMRLLVGLTQIGEKRFKKRLAVFSLLFFPPALVIHLLISLQEPGHVGLTALVDMSMGASAMILAFLIVPAERRSKRN